MNEGPKAETGPMLKPSRPYRHDMTRFNRLMEALSVWRNDDHEDAMWITRNQVIEIIENVKELRRASDPGRPVPPHGSGP